MAILRVLFIPLCLSALFGATEIPSIAPKVSSMFPHGGGQGAQITVTLTGTHLDGALILFSNRHLEGKIESAAFRSVRARISIAPDAEAGRHHFRVITPRGAWFGILWVGKLAESQEWSRMENGIAVQSQHDCASAFQIIL